MYEKKKPISSRTGIEHKPVHHIGTVPLGYDLCAMYSSQIYDFIKESGLLA